MPRTRQELERIERDICAPYAQAGIRVDGNIVHRHHRGALNTSATATASSTPPPFAG